MDEYWLGKGTLLAMSGIFFARTLNKTQFREGEKG